MSDSKYKEKGIVAKGFAKNLASFIMTDPIIEFEGNRRVNIEGSRGVLHYGDTEIKISFQSFVAVFEGRALRLKCISPTSLVIEGFLVNTKFEF